MPYIALVVAGAPNNPQIRPLYTNAIRAPFCPCPHIYRIFAIEMYIFANLSFPSHLMLHADYERCGLKLFRFAIQNLSEQLLPETEDKRADENQVRSGVTLGDFITKNENEQASEAYHAETASILQECERVSKRSISRGMS